MKAAVVTGSTGLVGAEAVRFYERRAERVVGVDNNARGQYFGPDGDTTWQRRRLQSECRRYIHVEADVRDRERVAAIVAELRPEVIIHCATQPSHDLAAKMPFVDFETNAVGTLNLLEAARQHAPETCFVFMSTNKVYGDAPNRVPLRELPTRWDYASPRYADGINEDLTIDRSTHSLFGASKVAADVLVQEYGRYFGMKTVCFRAGCITGGDQSPAELHGFLAFLVRTAVLRRPYTIFGYKGKQVRDQIHSRDVILAIDAFVRNPSVAAVYNLGGGRHNSVSILEAIDRVEQLLQTKMDWSLSEQGRVGDHICYYSDLTSFCSNYPDWHLTMNLEHIFEDLVGAWRARLKSGLG
jgi:CDP-paratose 2-epimerase